MTPRRRPAAEDEAIGSGRAYRHRLGAAEDGLPMRARCGARLVLLIKDAPPKERRAMERFRPCPNCHDD